MTFSQQAVVSPAVRLQDHLVAREAKALLAAEAGAGVALTFRRVLGAALEFLAAGLGARRAGLVAEGVTLPVPAALPGTRLLARRAGRSARLLAVAMAAGRAALLLARQTVSSAGQATLVTAAWQRATALHLARDVHAPRPARAARAFAHVTAVQSDATWAVSQQLFKGNVAR